MLRLLNVINFDMIDHYILKFHIKSVVEVTARKSVIPECYLLHTSGFQDFRDE